MNIGGEEKSHKIKNDLIDKDGVITRYDSFLTDKMKKKKLTLIDKEQLEKFIEINLDTLSGLISAEKIDQTNPNIEVALWAPKISTAPITTASMTYTYIIKEPTSSTKGIYGDFSSSLVRKDEKSPWQYSDLSMLNLYDFPILTDFDKIDYDKLNLNFSEKFFLSDLESHSKKIDFSPVNDYKKFASSNRNSMNYVFYKYSTIRNSIPLTVIFGVEKDQYNEHEMHPKNWYYVYMKRDGK